MAGVEAERFVASEKNQRAMLVFLLLVAAALALAALWQLAHRELMAASLAGFFTLCLLASTRQWWREHRLEWVEIREDCLAYSRGGTERRFLFSEKAWFEEPYSEAPQWDPVDIYLVSKFDKLRIDRNIEGAERLAEKIQAIWSLEPPKP